MIRFLKAGNVFYDKYVVNEKILSFFLEQSPFIIPIYIMNTAEIRTFRRFFAWHNFCFFLWQIFAEVLMGSEILTQTNFVKTAERAAALREKKDLLFAKKGLVLGIIGGITWAVSSVFLLGMGVKSGAFAQPEYWLVAPFAAAGIHDFCGAVTSLAVNAYRGQLKEIPRTIKNKAGRLCMLGGFLGAPFGMGGYLMAVSLTDPAYVLPITSLYPAFAAILAMVFLKEKIIGRAWIGLLGCIFGVFIISFVAPSGGGSEYFYLGLLFAVVAACGWACEGVVVTSGMDFVEPGIALNIYQMTSACIYWFILIPLACHFTLPADMGYFSAIQGFLTSDKLYLVMLAGIVGACSYMCWYKAMNTTGVSRAMALNITYALWGVVLSAVFLDTEITVNLVIGAVVIFSGMVLVIGNPKDIVNLRQVG